MISFRLSYSRNIFFFLFAHKKDAIPDNSDKWFPRTKRMRTNLIEKKKKFSAEVSIIKIESKLENSVEIAKMKKLPMLLHRDAIKHFY